ncbi:MAG TPA: response regulator transcription factor [Anaerolineae bacterium]|nr:response regulator transcription factor [Anaerolineae bacterium]
MHTLLISQDPDETAVLALTLQRAGMTTTRARELPTQWTEAVDPPIDLIVLVIVEGSPISKVQSLRTQTTIPLMVVAEHLDEATHAVTLDAGADIVVLRPYSARLLIAQVRALMRRAADLPFFTLPTLSLGVIALDPATRTVVVGNHSPQRLTQLEFRLLYTLMVHHEQVLPNESIIEQVWGYTGEGDRDLVRGLVRRLRTKVEPDPRQPQYIITVPSVGYSFTAV